MKKLYFLLFSILPLISLAQGSINFDDDTKWTQGAGGTANYTSYSDHSYTDGVFTATGVEIIRQTTADQDGVAGANGTYSIRLRNNATTQLTMTIASGGVGNFSFQVRRWDGTPDTNFTVEYSTDGGGTWNTSSVIDASLTTDSNWKTVNGVINSTNSNIQIRLVSNGTTERIMVDDFSWTSPSSDPSILISSPSNGTVYDPYTTSVDVALTISNFNVANGTGDGHIHYTINGGSIIMKYDTTPISIPVSAGNTYSIYVELVDNSHNPIVPATNATVNFEVTDFITATTISAVRNDVITNGAGRYYQITGEALVTYTRPATRNQKYIQDATGGLLIDDNTNIITNTFNIGDGMTGLKGQTSLFNGVLQFLPTEDITVSSTGNTITPQVVTAAEISANIEAYESELVQINNATFTTADGTIVFSTSTPGPNYNINDGSDLTFRAMFSEADYIGQVIPTTAQNLIVLVAEFNGTAQVVSRNMDDVNGVLSTKNFNTIDGLTMYPNPVSGNTLYINTTANAVKQVQVYNVLGKQVINTTVANNSLNVANLTSGVYIVKITEEGKTATRKLVVK
ncbi:T9SS type A sorting domain-containing protein [Flavobacterium sp. U410]|jgi:hypothetical protein